MSKQKIQTQAVITAIKSCFKFSCYHRLSLFHITQSVVPKFSYLNCIIIHAIRFWEEETYIGLFQKKKKEHVEILGFNYKRSGIFRVAHKKIMWILMGLGFWPWNFQGVSQNFVEFQRVKLSFFEISKVKVTNLKIPGGFFKKIYSQPPCL